MKRNVNQAEREYKHVLADISCSRCCHSNATRAPIANPPNNAQLEGTPYHSSKFHPGPCMRPRTDRQTQVDRQTDARDHYTFRVVYDSHEM